MAGQTLKYKFRLPSGERYEVADLDKLRSMYPTAHITTRVVDDGQGGSRDEPFTGMQPYEVAERKAERDAERQAEQREERLTELRRKPVEELRSEAVERELDLPDSPKKDDLVMALLVADGFSVEVEEAEPGKGSETQNTAPDSGDAAQEVAPGEEPAKVGVEAEKGLVSRDTARSRRS